MSQRGERQPPYRPLYTWPPPVRRVLEALLIHRPHQMYLFGSWARGEADDLSDVDVVIILESTQPFLERLLSIGRSLPLELGAVDLFAYTPEEWAQMKVSGNIFVQMVMEEGVLVYDETQERGSTVVPTSTG